MIAETATGALHRVLVLVAHPDDAELAVGGTIALLTDAGVQVAVAHFTTSELEEGARLRRREAAHQAASILGHEAVWVLDGKHDQVEELPEHRWVRIVDELIAGHRPDLVITHCTDDSHVDHVRLGRAVVASSRRWAAPLYVFAPNEYRAQPFLRFQPNTFVDISAHLGRKLDAVRCYNYGSPGFRSPETEAVAAIAAYYGALAGFPACEALQLVRQKGLPVLAIGR